MAKNERRRDRGVADFGVGVGMQIAAAKAHHAYLEQHFTAFSLWLRDFAYHCLARTLYE